MQLSDLVSLFCWGQPGMIFQFEPELDAFLEFLIWRFSIWVDKPTPGNALMNMRYRDERAMEIRVKGKKVWTSLAYCATYKTSFQQFNFSCVYHIDEYAQVFENVYVIFLELEECLTPV